jgi:hypothetical protein
MYLWSQYIKVRKLFKGGNYLRAETIRGNTVSIQRESFFKKNKRTGTKKHTDMKNNVNFALNFVFFAQKPFKSY